VEACTITTASSSILKSEKMREISSSSSKHFICYSYNIIKQVALTYSSDEKQGNKSVNVLLC